MEKNESEIEVNLSGAQNILSAKEEKALLAYFKKHVPIKEDEKPIEDVKAKEKGKEKL